MEQLISSVDGALEAVREVYGDLYDPNQNNNDQETETIEIIGTHVIPEFAEIAPIVLATSLIGIIALRRYKN